MFHVRTWALTPAANNARALYQSVLQPQLWHCGRFEQESLNAQLGKWQRPENWQFVQPHWKDLE